MGLIYTTSVTRLYLYIEIENSRFQFGLCDFVFRKAAISK
jgi:hypothetical protein